MRDTEKFLRMQHCGCEEGSDDCDQENRGGRSPTGKTKIKTKMHGMLIIVDGKKVEKFPLKQFPNFTRRH